MKIIEVPRPHGFLLWRGKQTAIPSVDLLPDGVPCLIVSDGEAFGTVTLSTAASMDVGEFERTEWTDRHRTRREERKMWWPDETFFCVQDVTDPDWYQDGSVPVDVERDDKGFITDVSFKDVEPATSNEQDLTSRAQRMPRLIMLSSDAIGLTGGKLYGGGDNLISVDTLAQPLLPYFRGQLERALCAVFDVPEESVSYTAEKSTRLPLYWLALVRAPRFGIERSDVDPEFKCLDVDLIRQAWAKQNVEVLMPFTLEDFPEEIAELPEAARAIWIERFNLVFERSNDEDAARQAAWVAVRQDYEQDADGVWGLKQISKTEGGQEYTADAFLFVPDPETPSTWKLRIQETPGEITRSQLGRAATALGPGFRGQRVQMPTEDRLKASKQLIAEYRKLDVPDEEIPVFLWRLADMEPPEGAKAAVALDDDLNKVNEAFERQFPRSETAIPAYSGYYWITRSFKDHVIVELENRDLYKVSYTKRGDDIMFVPREQWVEVEIEYQEIKEVALPETDELDLPKTDDPESSETDKAGRRIRKDKIEMLKDLKDRLLSTITELLSWAEYADREPEVMQAMFDKEAGFAIKEVDGEPWFVTWSTNAFEDREKEIFSTKSLEQFVKESDAKDSRGHHNFWHIPGTDFTDIKWHAVVSRFLVQAGPFRDDEAGRKAHKFFTKYPQQHPKYAPEGWGCSPEYKYLPEERKTGVYDWIWINRTSVLPRATAANIWAGVGEGAYIMPLEKGTVQYDSAVELFGEGYVKKLITDAEQKTTELEDAGVASKEADTEAAAAPLTDATAATPPAIEEEEEGKEEQEQATPSPVADPIPVEIDIEALAEQIEKSFTADLAPLAEGVAGLATVVNDAVKRIEALEKSDLQKSDTELPRYQFSLKRASDAEETAVKDDDSLKEKKPEETENTDGSIASRFFPARK